MLNKVFLGRDAGRVRAAEPLSAASTCLKPLPDSVKDRPFPNDGCIGDLAGVRDRLTIMAAPENPPTSR